MMNPGDIFKPGLLIVTEDPSQNISLASSELQGMCRAYFCGKKDNVFTALENKGIKTVILDLADDTDWDAKLLKIIKTVDPMIDIVVVGPHLPSEQAVDWINQ